MGVQKMGSGRCLLVFRYLFRVWAEEAFPLLSMRWLWRTKGGRPSFFGFGLEWGFKKGSNPNVCYF